MLTFQAVLVFGLLTKSRYRDQANPPASEWVLGLKHYSGDTQINVYTAFNWVTGVLLYNCLMKPINRRAREINIGECSA